VLVLLVAKAEMGKSVSLLESDIGTIQLLKWAQSKPTQQRLSLPIVTKYFD